MNIWVDKVQTPPTGHIHSVVCKNIEEAKTAIIDYEQYICGALDELDFFYLDDLSIDDDGTIFFDIGNDDECVGLLNWLEETSQICDLRKETVRNCIIRVHSSMAENINQIIQRNGWEKANTISSVLIFMEDFFTSFLV